MVALLLGESVSNVKAMTRRVMKNIELVHNGKSKVPYAGLIDDRIETEVVISDLLCRPQKREHNMSVGGPKSSAEARSTGNTQFQAGEFANAIRSYELAMELDQTCALAASNAAEAALQLKDYKRAFDFSKQALEKDSTHKKSWFRYIKSLAGLSRAAEAYVWIANQAASTTACAREDQVGLFADASLHSPTCYKFTRGLIIETCSSNADGPSQYRVITTRLIRANEIVSKEMAVVPWCSAEHKDIYKMKACLDTISPEQIELINGIFPRAYEEIPWNATWLAELPQKIRSLKESAAETQVKEWCRVLACASVCAFDNGIHHFSSFYNHSCEPNCEVRSIHNLEVVANQDVPPGGELCISYKSFQTLDLHGIARQRIIQNSYGNLCFCSRCERERNNLNDVRNKTKLEQEFGEVAVKAFLLALESENPQFTYPPDLQSHETLKDWQAVPWKKACVLNHQFNMLSQEIMAQMLKLPGLMLRPELMALQLVNNLQELERKGAFLCLSLLVEHKVSYISKTSSMMHSIYQIMAHLVDLFLSADMVSIVSGFQSTHELKAKKQELTILLSDAEKNSSLTH